MESKIPRRGEIWYVNLGDYNGSIQGDIRPCLVLNSNIKGMTIYHVIPFTSKIKHEDMITHITVGEGNFGLTENSMLCIEQQQPVNENQFIRKIGFWDNTLKSKVLTSVKIFLGIMNN